MSLPTEQIKFLETQMISKTRKEIWDMVGFFYKQNLRKGIKNKREPKPIKDLIKQVLNKNEL